MKLTLGLLCSILEEQGLPSDRSGIADESAGYSRVGLLAGKRLAEGTLYVCTPEQAAAVLGAGIPDAGGVVLAGLTGKKGSSQFNTARVNTNLPFAAVFNTVSDVYHGLSDWHYRMRQACYRPDAIKQIIDIAQERIPHPMYAADPGFKVYAMSEHPELCNVSYSWRYAYNQGYLPLNIILRLSESKELQHRRFFGRSRITSSDCFYTRFTNYVVYHKKTVLGHFIVIEILRQLTDAEIALSSIVGDCIGYVLSHNTLFNVTLGSLKEHFIADVIKGTLTDPQRIKTQLEALKWYNVWFCMACVELETGDRTIHRSFCNIIETEIKNATPVLMEDRIAIIIVFADEKRWRRLEADLLSLVSRYKVFAGVSDRYDDFYLTPHYHQQALLALRHRKPQGQKGRLIHYTQLAFRDFVEKGGAAFDVTPFVHPVIWELQSLDEAGGTDYYNTLKTYILCDRGVGKAAQALYLHRNTLMNRLERIQAATGLDLDDYQVIKRLILSFEIVGLSQNK